MSRVLRTSMTLLGCALLALSGSSVFAEPQAVAVEVVVDDDFFALDEVIEADEAQADEAAKAKAKEEKVAQDAAAKAKVENRRAIKVVGKAKPAANAKAVAAKAAVAKQKVKRDGAIQAIFNVFRPRAAVRAAPAANALGDRAEDNSRIVDADTDEELDAIEKGLPAQAKGFLQQFGPQFDAVCREELRFVHIVCTLKRSEFKAIEEVAKRTCRKALLQTVKVQLRMQQGWNGRNPPIYPDTQGMMEEALLKVVDDVLSKERAAAYREEVLARQAFRQEAGVETIVASLDRQLIMSPDQRNKVREPIAEAWQDEWQRNIEMLVNGNNYLPRLPNAEIRKALSPEQRTVYSSIPQNASFFTGQPFGMAFVRGRPQAKDLEKELEFAPEEDP